MGLIFESFIVELIVTVVLILLCLRYYISSTYDYWEKRGVTFPTPTFPYGNIRDIFYSRVAIGPSITAKYDAYKGHRYYGIFEMKSPTLVLRDLDLVKCVMTKDFQHFVNRPAFPRHKNDYIQNHLFNMQGDEWRHMRMKLSPTFTSGKMKLMFNLMVKCSKQMEDYLDPIAEKGDKIDIKDTLARFTTDIIGTCAFGLDVNSISNSNCEFYRVAKQIFGDRSKLLFRRFVLAWLPFIVKFKKIALVNEEVTTFLTKVVEDTVEYRLKNNVQRNDFLDLMIKINRNENIDDTDGDEDITTEELLQSNRQNPTPGLTLWEMTAQSFIFFAAGFETASSTVTFCLLELAANQDVQDRLVQEVDTVLEKHDGKMTYQALQEMTYMDQVINETLRRYGSVPFLLRKCTKNYPVPNSDLVLEKGTRVMIPSYAIHHDSEYYPNPYKFDPERFTAENVKTRHQYSHLPFGEGPRICIGMRFGKMQTKVGLTTILSRYHVDLTPDIKLPIAISTRSFITMPEHTIYLQLSKR